MNGQHPTVDLRRERSVVEILRAAADLYRAYPLVFVALALAVMAPFELIVLAATGYGPLRNGHEDAATAFLILLLRSALIGPLISALQVHAVVEAGEGQRPRLVRIGALGLRVLPVVAAANIMAAIGIGLGLLALVVPGVLLALRWAVVAQAAALEKESWLDALSSSARLTRGSYPHVFALLVAFGLIGFLFRLGGAELEVGSSSGVASVALGIAIDTAVASFSALSLALLYFDLRARRRETPAAPNEAPPVHDPD